MPALLPVSSLKRERNGSTRAWRRIREQILERDQGLCHWCGAAATTADHVVPIAQGGGDDMSNLVACCVRCNSSRGARMGRTGKTSPSRGW